MAHLRVISCVCVIWVLLLIHPLGDLQQVLSLLTPSEEAKVSTDCEQFFRPIVAEVNIRFTIHKVLLYLALYCFVIDKQQSISNVLVVKMANTSRGPTEETGSAYHFMPLVQFVMGSLFCYRTALTDYAAPNNNPS